jgi:hypothetical protein
MRDREDMHDPVTVVTGFLKGIGGLKGIERMRDREDARQHCEKACMLAHATCVRCEHACMLHVCKHDRAA